MRKNRGNRFVSFQPCTKKEWLNKIPDMIQTLNGKYHFYWSKLAHHITKPIQQLVESKRDDYRGKIVLYKTDSFRFYLVVYKRYMIDIYYLPDKDNYIDTEGKASYFVKKWRKYYKCLEELE